MLPRECEKAMGLDTIELIIAVERRFAIEIPDKAAAQIATVNSCINTSLNS
jgi:acyl carrier protein